MKPVTVQDLLAALERGETLAVALPGHLTADSARKLGRELDALGSVVEMRGLDLHARADAMSERLCELLKDQLDAPVSFVRVASAVCPRCVALLRELLRAACGACVTCTADEADEAPAEALAAWLRGESTESWWSGPEPAWSGHLDAKWREALGVS